MEKLPRSAKFQIVYVRKEKNQLLAVRMRHVAYMDNVTDSVYGCVLTQKVQRL